MFETIAVRFLSGHEASQFTFCGGRRLPSCCCNTKSKGGARVRIDKKVLRVILVFPLFSFSYSKTGSHFGYQDIRRGVTKNPSLQNYAVYGKRPKSLCVDSKFSRTRDLFSLQHSSHQSIHAVLTCTGHNNTPVQQMLASLMVTVITAALR